MDRPEGAHAIENRLWIENPPTPWSDAAVRRAVSRPFCRPLLGLLLASTPGCFSLAGWLAPDDALAFPAAPLRTTEEGRYYDVDGNGVVDFALLEDASGKLERLCYDDDENGVFEHSHRIGEYATEDVPHLVLLVDSLPFREVARRWATDGWSWFHAPQKVIPPFPSMSVVIFAEILRAERQGGSMERYYDREKGRFFEGYRARVFGYEHAWQELLDYHLGSYMRVGMSYLRPRSWIESEFVGVERALDASARHLTLAYLVTSSAMLSRYGQAGLDECLDGLERLCLQLLYERRGAIRISIVSDHGHNLMPSKNFVMRPVLERAGFRVTDELEDPAVDVVLEIDGLVTYFAAHTGRPAEVADALLPCAEIQLATYREGERVLVRNRAGSAAIEERGGRLRYTPITRDVLGYHALLESLARAGRVDGDGFVSDHDWLLATVDHEWPDAPRRLWDGFHGLIENTPDVMFTLQDGHCAGAPSMERWIDMQSTHGGLNQINSDAVLLTMIRPIEEPLRSRDVMAAIEPSYRGPRDAVQPGAPGSSPALGSPLLPFSKAEGEQEEEPGWSPALPGEPRE